MEVYAANVVLDRPVAQSGIEAPVGVPPGVLDSYFDELVASGHIRREEDMLSLTETGMHEATWMRAAWREWIVDQLREWLPAADSDEAHAAKVDAAFERIVTRVIREVQAERERAAVQ
ncbi:hypothetical protein OG921_06850 [Aldersonia sp. NBC_00410]|uniref:hypothetical protein n=1 Tax=Aldersonia sp. NBC_00410 TaxID=2975954 RepID=UPI002258737B|nr:hypothetical protein [Aldersonia sp. NBC_00410]MCX5042883.1 hypothetical protein [Aldersonia sp. NBC_00410]